jgi:FKBP-type peptidyl-prolyl cis-trans isomerase
LKEFLMMRRTSLLALMLAAAVANAQQAPQATVTPANTPQSAAAAGQAAAAARQQGVQSAADQAAASQQAAGQAAAAGADTAGAGAQAAAAAGAAQPVAPAPTGPQLEIIDRVVGKGREATAGAEVRVNYTGWFHKPYATNGRGRKFDSSLDAGRTPLEFRLGAGNVIKGWEQGGLEVRDVENLRRHYARTCALWAENFESRIDEIGQLTDARRLRIWHVYLAGCAYAFSHDWISLYQIVCGKAGEEPAQIPWSRKYMYQ